MKTHYGNVLIGLNVLFNKIYNFYYNGIFFVIFTEDFEQMFIVDIKEKPNEVMLILEKPIFGRNFNIFEIKTCEDDDVNHTKLRIKMLYKNKIYWINPYNLQLI